MGFAVVRVEAARLSPPRIVSLAPSVTETIFALGAGAELVGVSDYCDYPPAATRLPHVGSWLTPNLEQIIALSPTIIIGADVSANQRGIAALHAMGYRTSIVDDHSIARIEQGIEQIGIITDRAQAARAIVNSINRNLAAMHARMAPRPPRKVLMVVGHQPMVAVGPGNYLDELISVTGGTNIAAGTGESWPRLSLEYVMAMKPEVILDSQMGSDPASGPAFWGRFAQIPAVRDHRVYGYPQEPTLNPGPRIIQTLNMLAARIHPEAFTAQPDRRAAMKNAVQ